MNAIFCDEGTDNPACTPGSATGFFEQAKVETYFHYAGCSSGAPARRSRGVVGATWMSSSVDTVSGGVLPSGSAASTVAVVFSASRRAGHDGDAPTRRTGDDGRPAGQKRETGRRDELHMSSGRGRLNGPAMIPRESRRTPGPARMAWRSAVGDWQASRRATVVAVARRAD